MIPELKTIEEFRIALVAEQKINAAMKTSETALKKSLLDAENRIAELEAISGRYKAKYGSLSGEPRPGITRPNFGC